MSQRIAVFDVDGTLLKGDSLRMAASRSRGPMGRLVAGVALLPWLLAWKLRLVSTGQLKERTLKMFHICQSVNRSEANNNAGWLLPALQNNLRPEALERLREHQLQGDLVLLCSASPRMLLQPLADWLGVELIATELQKENGRWRPALAGANCKGPEKVARLSAHLGPLALGDQVIEAYGDSKGDRELLQFAAIPHYRSFAGEPRPYSAPSWFHWSPSWP